MHKYFMSFRSKSNESNRLLIDEDTNDININMKNLLDNDDYILENKYDDDNNDNDNDDDNNNDNNNLNNRIKTIYKIKYTKYYNLYIKLLDNINIIDIPYNTELEKKVIHDIFINNKDKFYCYETITSNIDNYDSYDFCLPIFNNNNNNKIKSLTIERINIQDVKSHIEDSINIYIKKELLNNVIIPFLPKYKYYIYLEEFNKMNFNIKSKLITINNIQGYIIYLKINID